MTSNASKRILIAPLDWGLGHTSRCVPIIDWMRQNKHQVLFAGNAWQRSFITQTFPGIETIHLDGYDVSYSRHSYGFMLAILQQIPRLKQTVKKENYWLKDVIRSHKIDGIISDNRYGLFHKDVPSVIMTHQLMALSGLGALADNVLQRLHYRYIQRFNSCWVVDVQGVPNLSGKLGHPKRFPGNAGYMGLLSQFAPCAQSGESSYLLVLLSGPEPQRTLLSEKLWSQLKGYKGKVVFVEGSNNITPREDIPTHITYHRQLTRAQLQPILQEASMVVCRSGYSSLMDLTVLNKQAILIPTPGQTEQEYLAEHLHRSGTFFSVTQKDLLLETALKKAGAFPFTTLALMEGYTQYQRLLGDWIASL